eukprot:CAMPEP_0178897416 /NCGR_PEP_ID=MMETSP0786-20121207/1734_1 /TAXON_ID=186022 /ORGANISM="Thalassionema frauenfeldii, Strain CCMP 1798" /LENGTH=312 /DNA_ID=CAMNT_0020567963 /DNA_START=79 /DNA_END=1017 /DNA_ORIENTATION=+
MTETEPETIPYLHVDMDCQDVIVTELQPFDVLCCERINNPKYEGNKKFAALLAMSCQDYVAAKAMSERKKIVGSVVNSFILHSRAPGGRFLKSTNHGFVVISRRDAVEWVYKDLQQVLKNPSPPSSSQQHSSRRNNPNNSSVVGPLKVEQENTPRPIEQTEPPQTQTQPQQPQPTMEDNLTSMRNHEIEIEKSVENVLKEQKKIIQQMSAKGKFELDITKKIAPGILPWKSLDGDDTSNKTTVSKTTTTEQDCEIVRTETALSEQDKIDRRVAKILQKQKSLLIKMSGQGKFKDETIELIKSEMSSIAEVPI